MITTFQQFLDQTTELRHYKMEPDGYVSEIGIAHPRRIYRDCRVDKSVIIPNVGMIRFWDNLKSRLSESGNVLYYPRVYSFVPDGWSKTAFFFVIETQELAKVDSERLVPMAGTESMYEVKLNWEKV